MSKHPSTIGLRVALALSAAFAGNTIALAQPAATPKPTSAEAEVLRAEDALFAADVKRDLAAIARGFADEAIFVHANGMVQTKADYLRAAEAGTPAKSVEAENRVVRVFGNVGVVRGTKKLVVGEMRLSGTYLTVYIKRDGRWQMLDQQSSPAPRPPQGARPPQPPAPPQNP